jgi:hypothetical protein
MGVVFADLNGFGVRESSVMGAAGCRVYIDANNCCSFDAGDTQPTTNQFGAWAFGNVAPGQRIVRLEALSPYQQTLPGNNGARVNTLVGSSTISGITFGVKNTANLDFGDLPASYGVASHKVGAYWLGSSVDAELANQPSPAADGDDAAGIPDDEDGIEFLTTFTPGSNAQIKAFASRNSGYLQAWADWNNDGDFNDVGERIITNRLLKDDAAQNVISFAVPATAGAQVYLRFRYGEFATGANAISSPTGHALTGEVEDYLKSIPVVPAVVAGMPADFNQDQRVDGRDFLAWQRNWGAGAGATQAQGNANGDSSINGADLGLWKQSFGAVATAVVTATTGSGDYDGDFDVDGSDFLALQRNFGKSAGATTAQGDGNADGSVNASDLTAWKGGFGANNAAQAAFAELTTSGAGAGYSSRGGSYQFLADAAQQWTLMSDEAAAGAANGLNRGAVGALATRLLAGVDLSHHASVREFVHSVIAEATAAEAPDYQFLRRDQAFDEMLGSRRRQGLLRASDAETTDAVEDCDEAFATLADHLQWPMG